LERMGMMQRKAANPFQTTGWMPTAEMNTGNLCTFSATGSTLPRVYSGPISEICEMKLLMPMIARVDAVRVALQARNRRVIAHCLQLQALSVPADTLTMPTGDKTQRHGLASKLRRARHQVHHQAHVQPLPPIGTCR